MITLLSVFYISLIGILAMILLKRREFVTGRRSLVSRVGAGTDHLFLAAHSRVRAFVAYFNKKTFIAVVQLVAYHVLFHIRKVYVEIKHHALLNPHSKKVIDAVRGRGEIRHHGASFYLRRISSDVK